MDARKGRAKISVRITVQVSDDLKQTYSVGPGRVRGDNLQMLIRETLQAQVGGSRSETDLIDEVLKDVKQTGRGSSTRTCRARFTNCWSTPGNSPRPSMSSTQTSRRSQRIGRT